MTTRISLAMWMAGALVVVGAGRVAATDIDAEPINYSKSTPDNVIERLQKAIDRGDAKLEYDPEHGYVPAVLKALNVPLSSQMFVFSKTSLQRHRIGPKTPRAIYFNDDVYVGFCLRGDVVEISAVDSTLGTVFYTLDQRVDGQPKFSRQNDSCTICHASSQNQGFPGHLVRSVRADSDGQPVLSAGTHRTDHSSPLRERWGGWYVTGTSGRQFHLGNSIVEDKRYPGEANLEIGSNVTDLGDRFTVGMYPTRHSDIVALMVMEHQAEAHNRIVRASFLTRIALKDEAELNKALNKPADHRWDSTTSRIRAACEPLVKYVLFSGEAALTETVRGTTNFAREFSASGRKDAQGRSLRDLDLTRRLFAYPCSYLVYTDAFTGLPPLAKDYVFRRMWEVLSGQDTSPDFAHLSTADRTAVLEILRATKPDLPAYWR